LLLLLLLSFEDDEEERSWRVDGDAISVDVWMRSCFLSDATDKLVSPCLKMISMAVIYLVPGDFQSHHPAVTTYWWFAILCGCTRDRRVLAVPWLFGDEEGKVCN